MKKTKFYCVAGVMMVLCACKEKKVSSTEVPPAAQSGLTEKYPGASDVEWEQKTKDGVKVYEAEFKVNGKKVEAQFDSSGKFIKEE
ncbi:MAG TPA: hypothetical protein VNS32_11850 [Flavisolibacter sp.]|nr:hypothetical protein [Flavisolibacter sp.]